MNPRFLLLASAALVLIAPAAPVLARQVATGAEQAAPDVLSRTDRDAALTAIAAAVRASYVFPEKDAAIVARLEKARQDGRYDMEDAGVFAERVTEDLRAASGDRHMYMLYNPAQYAAATSASPADGAAMSQSGAAAFERRAAVRDHHGLVAQEILPGNIRYLKVAGFEWIQDETGAVYDSALRFLKDGDAVIIDVRGNPGGTHQAVRYLVSHFMDPDVLELTFLEGGQAPKQSWTLDHLPAGRLKGKPLYVLIDGNTGSAAEAFAYDVQQFKLGELVGAKTAGAANNNKFVPVAPGFMLSVSFGRPVHAVSQANWDGTGVAPTIEVASARALETAQSLALTRLAAAPGASPEALAEYAWARITVDAALKPVSIPPSRLKAWAGPYGEVTISLRDGKLWMARAERPLRSLTPLTADGLFAVDGSDRLRARFTDTGMETLWRGDPDARVYPRGTAAPKG
ncbi:peptidase S41 [Caulobacter sp. Root655]|uniref:S41 family peptidase n=1 Tax=Caulobacter sp. Root655 TaxID=1736578 RepID=UPI0006F20B72|nr:S41 family peptidase [Caulobacter sp. Root655]KRA64783.1 peptidase S41 [Caulobacter sp. Root655]